jgi:dihydroorotate dehydrogenase (NAD+) catalytic subunit
MLLALIGKGGHEGGNSGVRRKGGSRMSLEVDVGGLKLSSPVIGASGLFGFGDEYGEVADLSAYGAVVTKTITAGPREGNRPPRVADLGSGILNSIGLENPGIEWFVREKLDNVQVPCKLIVSIGGDTVEDYKLVAARLGEKEKVAALEINISCPNVRMGGIFFGRDPGSTGEVVKAVRAETKLPLIAKLPPLVACAEEVAKAALDAGADALAVSNTLPAISIDIEAQRPRLGGGSGGLSGPPLKPVSLFLVWKLAGSGRLPIIGIGGIETADDAVEYLLAGAAAFEIGSAILKSPRSAESILSGLEKYMQAHGYDRIEDFRGKALSGKGD